ncbi:MAG TPA: dihydrofolate reductase [Candidatus Nanoarchaeia archaeon]|nr:dihydrofolate reductase [Candidatus Nanoarchaeia archaeon]
MQKISLIAAIAKNRVIGSENKLLWKLPDDMKRFRQLTTGHSIIMGRKTFESIGRPLPNRTNIIITRDKKFIAQGCKIAYSVDEALKVAGDGEVFVIGGAEVYSLFLPKADKLYLTLIDKEFEGDACFPEYSKYKWKEVLREGKKSEEFDYSFVDLEK